MVYEHFARTSDTPLIIHLHTLSPPDTLPYKLLLSPPGPISFITSLQDLDPRRGAGNEAAVVQHMRTRTLFCAPVCSRVHAKVSIQAVAMTYAALCLDVLKASL